jgi:tryptophan synthase beta subunit
VTIAPEPNSFRTGPDERGRFGIFGGRFVAETLMPLILELEAAYETAKKPSRPRWRATARTISAGRARSTTPSA